MEGRQRRHDEKKENGEQTAKDEVRLSVSASSKSRSAHSRPPLSVEVGCDSLRMPIQRSGRGRTSTVMLMRERRKRG